MGDTDVRMSGPEAGARQEVRIKEPLSTSATDISSLVHQDSPVPTHKFSTFPTPQTHSSSQFGQFTFPQTPESPLMHQSAQYGVSRSVPGIMTPDSSPFISRIQSTGATQLSSFHRPSSSSVPFRLANSPSTSPIDSRTSQATSPFLAKLLATSRNPTPISSSGPTCMQIDDVFSPAKSALSPPPISPTVTLLPPPPGSGGEIERIRQAKAQEQQELESRRPEYLQRTKRESKTPDMQVHPSVGILESPNKGRRIKLFQETSEESFEESLMAGGYGRYRTADWVRQPQPLLLTTPGSTGPSKILSALEKAETEEPPPLTEKEMKKRKRLDAFRSDSSTHTGPSTLFPVELEGKGRVLLDIPNESFVAESPRKRGVNRRKKKGELVKDAAVPSAPEEQLDSPNWVDAEFPWRLRTEERTEEAKSQARVRLQVIEKFLERDTDDEDDEDVQNEQAHAGEDAVIPSSKWGVVYENTDDRPTPSRMGRGKMIPLSADPATATNLSMERKRRSYFPSDPADARAALLSKRSVRAISYRRDKRLRGVGRQPVRELLCVCRGTDDGRELVQCDDCKMWYHLQCLGIRHPSELGPENEPWFCFDCNTGRLSSPEPEDIPYREPIFAPTDDTPRVRRTYDPPFYQSNGVHDSPLPAWNANRLPRTPVRGGRDDDSELSSSGFRHDFSRYEPVTPHRERYNDDPTSTPSRGTKLSVQPAFATPKTTLFAASRLNGTSAFQTPSRRRSSGGNNRLPAANIFPSFDEPMYNRFPVGGGYYDDSPVRRTGGGRRGSFDGLAGPSIHMQEDCD